ncbi:MAG TPA: DMT family protein [Thermoanaerobaculia bacterium]|nr:DMT family protein [Thermoanaerobaculia bacterium]
MKLFLVPLLMLLASCLMALAWLGHLRFRDSIGFWTALAASWAIVLPEYALNVAATRYGHGTFSGAQMATFHLAFGVVAVAFVSRFVLGERLTPTQLVGFALLAVATVLICHPQAAGRAEAGAVESPAQHGRRPVGSLLSGDPAARG